MGCLNHSLQHDTSLKPSDSPRTATGTEKTSIDQHPYDHELKVLQHIIYMYGKDLKWVRCSNHNINTSKWGTK